MALLMNLSYTFFFSWWNSLVSSKIFILYVFMNCYSCFRIDCSKVSFMARVVYEIFCMRAVISEGVMEVEQGGGINNYILVFGVCISGL
jgi:hypothetical protein